MMLNENIPSLRCSGSASPLFNPHFTNVHPSSHEENIFTNLINQLNLSNSNVTQLSNEISVLRSEIISMRDETCRLHDVVEEMRGSSSVPQRLRTPNGESVSSCNADTRTISGIGNINVRPNVENGSLNDDDGRGHGDAWRRSFEQNNSSTEVIHNLLGDGPNENITMISVNDPYVPSNNNSLNNNVGVGDGRHGATRVSDNFHCYGANGGLRGDCHMKAIAHNVINEREHRLTIPHLETRWDYRLRRESCLVNLYPHPSTLSKAYVDLVAAWGWKSFTIIYETNEGLVRMQELLKAHGLSEYPITVRQLSDSGDYRPLLKQIKNSAESHIVLDCTTEKIYEVLKQAQQIGMMSDYHSYLITSLDLHTISLDEFKYGGTNITAFRLVDPENPEVAQAIHNWTVGEARLGKRIDFKTTENVTVIKAETALMYDAVHLFAKALHDLDTSQQIDIHPLSCDAQDTWPHGYSLINYMKIVEMRGLTDVIKFDHQGFRSDFVLDIVELGPQGLRKSGTWNSTSGVNFTRSYGEQQKEIVEILQNKTLIVTTILSSPYCMRKDSAEKLTGNSQFEGYAIDLIHEVSKILGFNYTIRLAPDGRYGSQNKETLEWDGMIKELLEQRADLAIADLTITFDREQVVDFTMPFMNLGISVLYRKPVKQPPNLFSFLSPLSLDVWIYMATAYLGVSVLLFILARFTPYEWPTPNPCDPHPEKLQTQFTLMNCMWFAIGSLMQQGCDFLPKAVSTRMVAGMWWFFTLIMISSYTANLAAFLTVERMDSPIESAEDLAKQTKIKYGALRGGSTAAFFRDSNFSTYQRMWSFMESTRPSVFTASNIEGVERVVKGKGSYAFLMESTSIEYVIERNCELTQVGGMLDSKGYGIAMPPNSPFRTAISGAVLKLQEEGKLHILKTRWWKEKRGGGSCRDETSKSSSTANELGLANVGGVFVVLMGGMGVACVIAVCEFVWKSRKVAVEERKQQLY